MTVDEVLKGLDCCAHFGNAHCKGCPYNGDPTCTIKLKKDAMSIIMQGELNGGTMKLINDQGDMIDELNCWNKLLWRFVHSDKQIEDSFYKFYNIKRKYE